MPGLQGNIIALTQHVTLLCECNIIVQFLRCSLRPTLLPLRVTTGLLLRSDASSPCLHTDDSYAASALPAPDALMHSFGCKLEWPRTLIWSHSQLTCTP
eukprot:1161108-Pelagomonas_calceolata.AAC.5